MVGWLPKGLCISSAGVKGHRRYCLGSALLSTNAQSVDRTIKGKWCCTAVSLSSLFLELSWFCMDIGSHVVSVVIHNLASYLFLKNKVFGSI